MPDDTATQRRDALLITDRAFMRPYDGSAAIYTAWLRALRHLGFAVSVISFNQAVVRWTEADIDALRAEAADYLILDAFHDRGEAALVKAERIGRAVVAGTRYAREAFGRAQAAANAARIAGFVARRRPRLVVVNKTLSLRLIGSALDHLPAIKLLDMHDNLPARARAVRAAAWRLLPAHPGLTRMMRLEDAADVLGWASEKRLLREEVRLLRGFDRVLFPDPDEQRAFVAGGLSAAHARCIPWPLAGDVRHVSRQAPRPYHLGFLGSAHLFNFEALDWLARAILPLIRNEIPDLRVLVAGSVARYARGLPAWIDTVPWVDQIADFYGQVDVVAVPLRSGTGVSVKTVEAACHAAAIVTTPVGMRGLAMRDGHELLVATNAAETARAVVKLLRDPGLRANLGDAAAAAAVKNHSLATFAEAINAIMREVERGPSDVRR